MGDGTPSLPLYTEFTVPALALGLLVPLAGLETDAMASTFVLLALRRLGGGGGAGPFLTDVTVELRDRPMGPLARLAVLI
jgi:hypothetical protein